MRPCPATRVAALATKPAVIHITSFLFSDINVKLFESQEFGWRAKREIGHTRNQDDIARN